MNIQSALLLLMAWCFTQCWVRTYVFPAVYGLRIHLYFIVNTMAADDLATEGARSSAAMVLTYSL